MHSSKTMGNFSKVLTFNLLFSESQHGTFFNIVILGPNVSKSNSLHVDLFNISLIHFSCIC